MRASLGLPQLAVFVKRVGFGMAQERDQGALPPEGRAQLPGSPETHRVLSWVR